MVGTKEKRGFTLIELLVVIAIIAVLAAILFPVFKSAQDAAKLSACQGNAKQIGSAMTLYLQDNNSTWPNWRIFKNMYPTLPNSGNDGLQWIRMAEHWFGGMPKLLMPYLKNKRVFWCPSDPYNKPFKDGLTQLQQDMTMVSFGYRYGFLDSLGLKDSQLIRPTKQACFFELIAYHKGMRGAWQSPGSPAPWNMKGQPDLVGVYADGHVGHLKLKLYNGTYDVNQFSASASKYPSLANLRDPKLSWDEPQ